MPVLRGDGPGLSRSNGACDLPQLHHGPEELTRACTSICGGGQQLCLAGAYTACDAQQPTQEIMLFTRRSSGRNR